MKGFFAGVLWGTVVAALGLAVASEVAPMPLGRAAADAAGRVVIDASAGLPDGVTVRRPVAADEVASPAPGAVTATVPDPVPDDPDAAIATSDTEDATRAPDPAGVDANAAASAAISVDDPVMDRPAVPAGDADPAMADAPAPAVNAVAPDAPVDPAPGPDASAPMVVADAPTVEPAPNPVTAPSADAGPAATEPPPPPAQAVVAPAPSPAPDPATDPAPVQGPVVIAEADPAPSPDADAAPAAAPVPDAAVDEGPADAVPVVPATDDALVILPVPETAPPVLDAEAPDPVPAIASAPAPTPGLDGTVDGVTTGRLPRIGTAAAGADVVPAPADGTPLARYARAFKNPDGKPAFAIVLIDQGLPATDRARLAALPFPITFALDPTMPQAAAAAADYRAAGQEVAMLATGIPPGATAADLEVTFEAHARALPEAVVVLDLESGGFQTDRALATQVVPVIAGQGRGVVTWDGGLNAGAQVAQRDGVAAGTVFRRFDPEGASVPTMRRMLDRAAFKAAQDGRVIVVGNASAELTVALLAWSLEGRASSVALAPVSAVLTKPAT